MQYVSWGLKKPINLKFNILTKGFNPVEYNKVKGRRVSSYAAFIKPYEASRTNLVVKRYAEVNEVKMLFCLCSSCTNLIL